MKKIIFLLVFVFAGHYTFSQSVTYGNNPAAGKFIQLEDAKLYYEVYGSGEPLLLLHGDTFGYISEFEQYIPLLEKYYKVIVPALRGHGKSEIGSKAYSYQLFAEDALAILNNEKVDSVLVVGFSAGATTAYYLAAHYPARVKKAVAMGGAIGTMSLREGILEKLKTNTGNDYEKMLPALVNSRKQLMPKPESYHELIEKLKTSWLQPIYVEREKLKAIQCPVLTIGGDRDDYMRLEAFVDIYQLIPKSSLAILPNRNHVGLILDPQMFSTVVIPFLTKKK